MQITVYCQHVLGIGHFFRTLEICGAFEGHEVVLVSGGPGFNMPLPKGIEEFRLPGLMMDRDFKQLFPTDSGDTLEQVKKNRRAMLWEYFRSRSPDLLLIELYPFGRKAFRFELDPILNGIQDGTLPPCRVVCSLRDILVEKRDPVTYEESVVHTLNSHFDAILIHADPRVIRLDETFSRIADIDIPIVYTGFITQKPVSGSGQRLRRRLGIPAEDILIVASAGGGKVGTPLLEAMIHAFQKMPIKPTRHLHLFSGPLMASNDYHRLKKQARPSIHVSMFTSDFLSYLSAADLSVSMAGYNTCMNILSSGVPALVWPFSQNQEQRLRAGRLQDLGLLSILETHELDPDRLAARMEQVLSEERRELSGVDLNGAKTSALWLDRWISAEGTRNG